MGTAPSRTDNEGHKQLHVVSNPEAPPSPETGRADALSNAGLPLDDVTRVERLLTQLEARSMALVPYGYGGLREVAPKKPNTAMIAAILVAIWLSTLVLAIVYIGSNRSAQVVERAPVAPLVIPSVADPQEQKVANSVDHLAKALVSSSDRLNQIEAAMEKSNRDLQHLTTTRAPVERSKPVSTPAAASAETATQPLNTGDVVLPKNWHKVLEVKPTDSAMPHKGADGNVDYWIVLRGADRTPTKVLPIGASAEGVVVHNLEDGKDYTLTPAGEWRSGSITPSGN
jgi:hypothetical protein